MAVDLPMEMTALLNLARKGVEGRWMDFYPRHHYVRAYWSEHHGDVKFPSSLTDPQDWAKFGLAVADVHEWLRREEHAWFGIRLDRDWAIRMKMAVEDYCRGVATVERYVAAYGKSHD